MSKTITPEERAKIELAIEHYIRELDDIDLEPEDYDIVVMLLCLAYCEGFSDAGGTLLPPPL